jgi:hypothetical protein
VSGKEDIITLKFRPNGTLIWDEIYDGENYEDRGLALDTDEDNNIFIAGYTSIEFGGSNTSTILLKYNASGSLKWTRNIESGSPGSEDKAFGIVVDSDGRIYITGQVTDQVTELDYFVSRYESSGHRSWLKKYNGPGNGEDYASAITMTNGNKIAVTGASWGTNENFDYATVVFNKNGNLMDAYRYSMAFNTDDRAKDIKSKGNSLFVTGFSELLSYSPGGNNSAISTLSYQQTDTENETELNAPSKFGLQQNYPNPFNPSTTIKFEIHERTAVKLAIYDIMGKEVDVLISQELDGGSYNITYTNKDLASGVYFYKLTAGEFSDVKKMTLVK